MKKLLLVLLFIPLVSFGQMIDKKIARIAKKNVEVILNQKFNNEKSFIVLVDKGTRKVEDKSQGVGNQLSKSLSLMGANVISQGDGNTIKMSIKWAALDELKRLSATITDSNSNLVGSIEYNAPVFGTGSNSPYFTGVIISNSHKNITAAIAYKLVEEAKKRTGLNLKTIQQTSQPSVSDEPPIEKTKQKAIKELKELKELLELELITQEEFDKKSVELKKIILDN